MTLHFIRFNVDLFDANLDADTSGDAYRAYLRDLADTDEEYLKAHPDGKKCRGSKPGRRLGPECDECHGGRKWGFRNAR